jgi:lipoate-protein ligase A
MQFLRYILKDIIKTSSRALINLIEQNIYIYLIMYFSKIPKQRFSTFKNLQVFLSEGNNIHFNLASEEYLYEHSNLISPTLFLWRNDKTVVIGKISLITS